MRVIVANASKYQHWTVGNKDTLIGFSDIPISSTSWESGKRIAILFSTYFNWRFA